MINLHHLLYFSDAARAKSLSVAARKNRVSQSAVSQAIGSLERSLGLRLTTHEKKRFCLTEEGKSIFLQSDQVFRSVDNLTQGLSELETAYSGGLSLGCTNSLATNYILRCLSGILRDHPGIRPKLLLGNSETIKDWIIRGECELGALVNDDAVSKDFQTAKIGSGKYVLFKSSSRNGNLRDERIIVSRRERSEVRYFIRNLSRQLRRAVEIHSEITSWEVIRNYVLKVGGRGICPDYVIRDELKSGALKAVPIAFKAPDYEIIAIWSSKRPLPRNERMLLDHLTPKT